MLRCPFLFGHEMKEHQAILMKLGLKIGLPLVVFVAGLVLIWTWKGDVDTVNQLLLGMAMLLVGGLLAAPQIVNLIAEPAGMLFFPGDSDDEIRPLYSIAEGKARRGHYEEAIKDYEKIAERFPEETKPYVDMISIAIVNLRDGARAEAIYRKGLLALQKQEGREVLTRMYMAIRTRLESKPEWLREQQERGISLNTRHDS